MEIIVSVNASWIDENNSYLNRSWIYEFGLMRSNFFLNRSWIDGNNFFA
jgi:hypothetical protein